MQNTVIRHNVYFFTMKKSIHTDCFMCCKILYYRKNYYLMLFIWRLITSMNEVTKNVFGDYNKGVY